MRSVYLLVGLFAVWCLLAAFWYLFWIKGLDPKPEHINPHESTIAIAEILVIVVVSLFIGFGIAWFLRQQFIDAAQSTESALAIELAELKQSLIRAQEQANKAEQTLIRARETFRGDFLNLSRENERLKTTDETLKGERELLQQEISQLQSNINDLQNSYTKVTHEKQKLETELNELKLVKRPLKENAQPSSSVSKETDNLKLIKGIGPGIESKLNKAGISSFRQISELTEESIDRIASIIEFFPGRISRDRWIEQASKLYLDKLRK